MAAKAGRLGTEAGIVTGLTEAERAFCLLGFKLAQVKGWGRRNGALGDDENGTIDRNV